MTPSRKEEYNLGVTKLVYYPCRELNALLKLDSRSDKALKPKPGSFCLFPNYHHHIYLTFAFVLETVKNPWTVFPLPLTYFVYLFP